MWNWRLLFKPFGARVVYFYDYSLTREGYRFLRKTPLGVRVKLMHSWFVDPDKRHGFKMVDV